jgi:23S rRNA pseudouridine2605 synthase
MTAGAGQRPGDGVRLAKFLAHAGVAARRRAERDFIAAGRVSVNGQVVTDPAVRVRATDTVAVDGRPVRPEPPVTFALYKPVGVVSTARDWRGRPTVVDLVRDAGVRLYPVGRLDTDSEGLILLTNDGALTYALLHPRHRVPRTYAALVRPRPGAAELRQLEAGVMLSDGFARAEAVRHLPGRPREVAAAGPEPEDGAWLSFVLREGRNREARRLCAAVGLDVLRLVRVRFGPLGLDGLAPGQARRLTADEVAWLRGEAAVRRR